MKKLYSVLLIAMLVLSFMPVVMAAHTSTDIGVDITTENFEPQVWQCNRGVFDDPIQPNILPRVDNYAFTGEGIKWEVLVMDKNGKEKISEVFATIGDVQGVGNDIEANCVRTGTVLKDPYADCGATIGEEQVTWNPDVMAVYECTLNIEPDMYGEYWATVEAVDIDGLSGVMADNEYWFLNPMIAVSVDGNLIFDDVRPGTETYSETLLIGNDADDGSGVRLNMKISGTDFYDSSSSGAMCPTGNVLLLNNFEYKAISGLAETGFLQIPDGNDITMALPIMRGIPSFPGANFLTPGAEMALTFKLNLPEPCNGDFDTGSIYFWGEAI